MSFISVSNHHLFFAYRVYWNPSTTYQCVKFRRFGFKGTTVLLIYTFTPIQVSDG